MRMEKGYLAVKIHKLLHSIPDYSGMFIYTIFWSRIEHKNTINTRTPGINTMMCNVYSTCISDH